MAAFSREFFSFVEVARQRSIRRAAERLNVSASALSRQMQLLERDFGTRLFVRVPQGIQLTEQGGALLQQAEKWLDEESGVRAAMRAAPASAMAPLRLGVMECLVPFLRAPLDRCGAPSLKVTVGDTGALVELLGSNRLDAAMAFNVPRLPEIRVYAERDDDLGLVYAPALAPAGTPPFRLEQCLDHPLCLPDAPLSVWPRLDAEVHRARADPRIVLRTNSIALILDFVAAGRGVSFLNWLDVAVAVSRGDLCFAPLANRRLSDRLYLVTPTNAVRNAETLKLVGDLFRALPSPRPADVITAPERGGAPQ
jgi:DNA-binding transcriptional LysR family regulator